MLRLLCFLQSIELWLHCIPQPRKHPDLHTTWRHKISLSLDAMVMKELRTSPMSFELWQCSQSSSSTLGCSYPKNNRPTHMLSDVWLGTASAPCLPLLFQKEGVHIDLCLKLSIYKQVEEIYKTLQKLQTILITFFSFELSFVQFKSMVFQNQHRNCFSQANYLPLTILKEIL